MIDWLKTIALSESLPSAELVDGPVPLFGGVPGDGGASKADGSEASQDLQIGSPSVWSDEPLSTNIPSSGDGESLGVADAPESISEALSDPERPTTPQQAMEDAKPPYVAGETLELGAAPQTGTEALETPAGARIPGEPVEQVDAPNQAFEASGDLPGPPAVRGEVMEIPSFVAALQPPLRTSRPGRFYDSDLEVEQPAGQTDVLLEVSRQISQPLGSLPIGEMQLADGRMHALYPGGGDIADTEDADPVGRFRESVSPMFDSLHDRLAGEFQQMMEERRIVANLADQGD